MAGYRGWSMSNNAVEAYKNGEKPMSKWTKRNIFEIIEKSGCELNCSVEKLKKLPTQALKDICLSYSSWHHTSNHYNKTDFYSVDTDSLQSITDEMLDELILEYEAEKKQKKQNKESTEEKWKCTFLEWGGTRLHPTAKEITEEGIVKGCWFYRKDGSKKKTTANGFRFVERLE